MLGILKGIMETAPHARRGIRGSHPSPALERELALGDDCSIVLLVEALVEHAHHLRASDIHIEPSRTELLVRARVDGVLEPLATCSLRVHGEVLARIKILAGLRTDEHFAAQDGRFRQKHGGRHLDVRVSIVPAYYGENAVLRILSDNHAAFSLESLGFSEHDRSVIEHAIRKTSGMILSTGPTGSGKTTTLYTLIKKLAAPEVSIVTIEDPIEYSIESVEQIQVNARSGLTFANGLRSILRQDPDIIMVGEIRDAETATIAVNTALTGHLLFSTLHTSDAATTLPRLTDMGIDPYLVAATMNIAIGQRLVRKICEACSSERSLTAEEHAWLLRLPLRDTEMDSVKYGQGCDACLGTAYKGRLSISEVLVAETNIRNAILRKASGEEIRRLARENGMTTMLDDGFQKVRDGRTSIEEVLRVVHE
ncbi:MAG: ral secretion pathway protein [Parcubacteria group bacterium]|nr:ral secretion pathway protein [Parcubacteria group bacterium]